MLIINILRFVSGVKEGRGYFQGGIVSSSAGCRSKPRPLYRGTGMKWATALSSIR